MFFNQKKGQGLSMNVIIIAAIALLVLVILTVLVLNAGNQTSKTGTCESIPGAYCASFDSTAPRSGCDVNYQPNTLKSCPGNQGIANLDNQNRVDICCMPGG